MPTDPGPSGINQLSTAYPEALNEPEKLLAAYFSSTTIGLSILDSDLRYLAINDVLAALNGRPVPDHLGKTVREILGDFSDVVEPRLRQVLETGESVSFESSALLPSRTEVGHWMLHYLPIKNAAGVVTRIGVLVVEISTQKKLEESLQDVSGKLRREMNRLQMLLDVSNILASNWDLQRAFPRISARIRRVMLHEYAGFELQDPNSGRLVSQVQDFPLSKGLLSPGQIQTLNSPGGQALHDRPPLVFSKEQIEGFEAEMTKGFLAEGIQSLCCVPLLSKMTRIRKQREGLGTGIAIRTPGRLQQLPAGARFFSLFPNGALGVLVLGSTRADAFQPEDLDLLNQVATQFAVALENHRTATEIDQLRQRLADERRYLEGDIESKSRFALVAALPTGVNNLEAIRHIHSWCPTYFCGFSDVVLDSLNKVSHRSALPAGAILFVEGQSPRGVFILCSGTVNLSTSSHEGKALILKSAEEGQALGLSAVISGSGYEATAETASPCLVNFIERKHFLALVELHTEVGLHTAQSLSRDFQSAYHDIHNLVLTRSSAGKLARLLLSQSAAEDTDSLEVRLRGCMTHEEMGQRIGASRETVTRLLSNLKRKKLIRSDGQTLVIRNRTALKALAV